MKITDHVYLIDSSRGSHVYLFEAKETILVDTGLPFAGKRIVREIESMGITMKDIKHILLTHHDIDHIGNLFMLQQLTGAKVWASGEDIPYIRGELDRHSFKKYLKYIFRTKIPAAIHPYGSGGEIDEVEIIPTPGHTPGHVCLLYDGVLFAGDLFENKGGNLRPYPRAWNWDNTLMAESAEKVTAMPVKWICPAHGMPVKRKDI